MRAAAGMTPMPAAGCENNLRPRDLPRCCFVLAQARTLRHSLILSTAPRSQRAPTRAARHAARPLTAEERSVPLGSFIPRFAVGPRRLRPTAQLQKQRNQKRSFLFEDRQLERLEGSLSCRPLPPR